LIVLLPYYALRGMLDGRLFSYHPLLASLAAIVGYSEGIFVGRVIHSPYRVIATYAHIVLQSVSVILAFSGMGVMFLVKQQDEDLHFQSPHALLGLVCFLLNVTQLGLALRLGTISVSSERLKQRQTIARLHHQTGIAVLLLCQVTMCIGLWEYYGKVQTSLCVDLQRNCHAASAACGLFRPQQLALVKRRSGKIQTAVMKPYNKTTTAFERSHYSDYCCCCLTAPVVV